MSIYQNNCSKLLMMAYDQEVFEHSWGFEEIYSTRNEVLLRIRTQL